MPPIEIPVNVVTKIEPSYIKVSYNNAKVQLGYMCTIQVTVGLDNPSIIYEDKFKVTDNDLDSAIDKLKTVASKLVARGFQTNVSELLTVHQTYEFGNNTEQEKE